MGLNSIGWLPALSQVFDKGEKVTDSGKHSSLTDYGKNYSYKIFIVKAPEVVEHLV
jgi:hypothetical protein